MCYTELGTMLLYMNATHVIHGSGVAPACLARLSISSVKSSKYMIRIYNVRENVKGN